jgi:pilus assembly protein Flp/PilA
MTLLRFLRDERGATAIEYALIASLIGMVIVSAVMAIGQSLGGTFNDAAAPLG